MELSGRVHLIIPFRMRQDFGVRDILERRGRLRPHKIEETHRSGAEASGDERPGKVAA